MNVPHTLPFPALVGLDAAQQALLLLAIEPRLRGVVLAAPAGAGKSSLARSFRTLLDATTPFVELPLHADEDSLLGGLDLEATLRTGKRVIRQGIFARADGGVLYVDGLNLLPDTSAHLLIAAFENGAVQLEREGISQRILTHFSLIGTYDPAEGLPRRHLLDRAGLLAVVPQAADVEQRAEVVRNNLGSPLAAWDEEFDLLLGLVQAAREQLPLVTIADTQVEQLLAAALAFGVEGQRADLFAVRAACAAAALDLRDRVEHEDLELALRLVIAPRATRQPTSDAQQPQPQPEQKQAQQPESEQDAGDAQIQQPSSPRNQERSSDDSQESQDQQAEPEAQSIPEEQIFAALDMALPVDLAELPFRAQRRGRSGSRGTTSGRRGRHIRSMPGDPRRARIDISATLRTAAPWQAIRQDDKVTRRQGDKVMKTTQSLTVSPPHSVTRSCVILQADDLRVKEFRSKAGALFCFAVDASGSMALHRMRQAKGAVHALLQRAYVHRDRVALLAFHGQSAEVLLPPSQSVELARRALDQLPTGGGTPLAAALVCALDVARQARGRGIFQTVLVLLTDGRANIGLRAGREGVARELEQISQHLATAGIQTIVIDTQRTFLSKGEAKRLAGWLGGTYVYLPNASGEQVADLAMAVAG